MPTAGPPDQARALSPPLPQLYQGPVGSLESWRPTQMNEFSTVKSSWICQGRQVPTLRTQRLTEQGFPALKELPIWWALEEKGPPFLWHQEEVLMVLDEGINTQAVPPIRPWKPRE